ncbi:hypothetical protein SAMN02745166_04875 [Prosthecobacter debontii]|uniref:Uncharacterized protein n=1 Tax=Prosthecobacter debontii TaxID=48467 RepID=A0A1T4Z2D5_9BACT|nr:hypothetical protein [Prosthecobacter debontii]SKB08207.1 hypothetical protein SAMN02745166_04875 [Prosthecobacter debontii]
MLPYFSLDQTVVAETARQDRILFTMNLGKLEGSTHQIDRFRKALHPVPADGFPETLPSHGCIFNRPEQPGAYRAPQLIRSIRDAYGIHDEPPLFAGELKYGQYYRPSMDDPTRSKLRLSLNCNPTRYARFCPPSLNVSLFAREPFGNKAEPAWDGESSLDFNDNWLPKGTHTDYYNPERWKRNVFTYLSQVKSAIQQDISTANLLAGTSLSQGEDPLFVFHLIETYWEFESANPIGLVHTFKLMLKEFGFSGRETAYEKNCLVLKFNVGSGVILCIYAKTDRRVRFEVRHQLSSRARPSGIMKRTCKTLAGAMKIIMGCRADAVTLVNNALQTIRSKQSVSSSHINETLLIVKIGRIVKNDNLAVMFVELLRSRGAICPNNSVPTLHKALRGLQRHGIMKWCQINKHYILTDEYAYAGQQLASRAVPMFVPPEMQMPPVRPASSYPRRNRQPTEPQPEAPATDTNREPSSPAKVRRSRDAISRLLWD